jgi:2-oxoglutarate dehydrogenase E2 component (dihydrolipoamide succinyltransferase)
LLVEEGARVRAGVDLAEIDDGGAEATLQPPATPPPPAAPEPTASPASRKLARERGVDLTTIVGTGDHGRVTRQDVLRYADAKGAEPVAPQAPSSPPSSPPIGAGVYRVPEVRPEPGDEVIPFDRRRQIIAEHMVHSKNVAPHVTCVAEVDLARVSAARAALPKEERPSFTAYVAAAAVRALREVPRMNAAVPPSGDAVVLRKAINLGVAVDVPEGLVVPVIRHADRLSLRGIADAIGELAAKARDKTLRPDDLSGATFTLSNPGQRGNLYGTAIINQPQVGILRMGEIEKRPTVISSAAGGDAIAIHPKMYLALSYDHRVIDGVLGNDFLRRVRDFLEAGELN